MFGLLDDGGFDRPYGLVDAVDEKLRSVLSAGGNRGLVLLRLRW